jgi:hypothetical protein
MRGIQFGSLQAAMAVKQGLNAAKCSVEQAKRRSDRCKEL